jgi:hypothetical protein
MLAMKQDTHNSVSSFKVQYAKLDGTDNHKQYQNLRVRLILSRLGNSLILSQVMSSTIS